MVDLDDLQIQVRRMQAMLTAHEHLMFALFDQIENKKAVVEAFESGTQTTEDLMLADSEFSDIELEDQAEAKRLILDSLSKAVK